MSDEKLFDLMLYAPKGHATHRDVPEEGVISVLTTWALNTKNHDEFVITVSRVKEKGRRHG